MSTTIKYAYLRRQTWMYRRNYPMHLQPVLGRALKKSLRTGDARTARARVAELNVTFGQIVREAESRLSTQTKKNGQLEPPIEVYAPRYGRIPLAGQAVVAGLAKTYLDRRSRELSVGGFKSVRFSVGLFVSVYGSRRITDLRQDDGQAFLRQIVKLCPDIAKSGRNKGLGLRELVARSDTTARTITPQTQKRIWKQVCQFLDWAVSEGHIQDHCFGGLSVAAKSEVHSYAVPTEGDVTALLQADDPTINAILSLCFLSGLRSGEACGLLAEDIVTKGNLGVFIMVRPNRLRQLKSKAAEREIPLHDQWLPRLQSLPCTGPLFPNLSVDKITKRFTTLRRDLQLDKPGLVFHSTRKWFITQCERTGVPEHFTASLVGHQAARSENKLTYGLYSAGISDSQKREIVDQVRLPAGVQA